MEKNTLKNKILEANEKYRCGNPIMEDQEYDNLVEEYKNLVSDSEYNEFRDSLNEGVIENGVKKVTHKYIAGSLDKIKAEEPEDVLKFLNRYIKNKMFVSAKIDGLSGIAKYVNGHLTQLSTRGNGCVSDDSILEFEDGRKIPIGVVCKLKIYGKVKSSNISTGKIEFKNILFHNINKHTDNWLKITFCDGREVKVTSDHKIYTSNRGYVSASELTEDDDVISINYCK